MIIAIIGGIGQGKTLTAVKEIVTRKTFAYTNFKLKHFKNYHRIRYNDIIIQEEKLKDWRVNWDFWKKATEKNKNYSVYLDEIHNVVHARRSMSKTNILMSKWVSQIRKVLSDKPNNHLYIISQTLSKIDKDFRDLTQMFITCRTAQLKRKLIIINDYHTSAYNVEIRNAFASSYFHAERFFNNYDTNEMIRFEDAEEFI